MAKELKKSAKPEEPDLLPAMGLFTILIPMLLSMTSFSKLAMVEVNLPERSNMVMDNETPPDPDEQALNLTVAIHKDKLEIAARGGFQPGVYFKEMWTFRCKSDSKLVTYSPEDVAATVESGHGPKCENGTEMDKEKYLFEIETIHLWAIQKESEEDPGRIAWGLYTSSGEDMPDSALVMDVADRPTFVGNGFWSVEGEGALGATAPSALKIPTAGMSVTTLAENSKRALKPDVKVIKYPLSAYDVIARQLIQIHTTFIDLEDIDKIIILAGDDTQFDKIIQMMDRAKEAGFNQIQLAKLAL